MYRVKIPYITWNSMGYSRDSEFSVFPPGALTYDPETPQWPNRDRMVLSAGHLSALLYSLLHVAGVKEMQELN